MALVAGLEFLCPNKILLYFPDIPKTKFFIFKMASWCQCYETFVFWQYRLCAEYHFYAVIGMVTVAMLDVVALYCHDCHLSLFLHDIEM
jgi:hypothetical protein